jgi:molybdopterin synthase catalytic subunit
MNIDVTIIDGPLGCDASFDAPPGAGAVLTFRGIVRPTEARQPIIGLSYQVYEPMASSQLRTLAEQAVRQFGLLALRVTHSRGFVPNHGCSLVVDIAAAHRREALDAMDWYIDALKRDVPIWKTAVHPASSPAPQESAR